MYKIVESPEGQFRVYKKKWLFWRRMGGVPGYFDIEYLVLSNKRDADEFVAECLKKDSFKKRTWYVSPL